MFQTFFKLFWIVKFFHPNIILITFFWSLRIRHKREPWRTSCWIHDLLPASDVRMTTSGQTASSATVVRIPLRLPESLPPLFSQETQGRQERNNQSKSNAQRMAIKLELHYG